MGCKASVSWFDAQKRSIICQMSPADQLLDEQRSLSQALPDEVLPSGRGVEFSTTKNTKYAKVFVRRPVQTRNKASCRHYFFVCLVSFVVEKSLSRLRQAEPDLRNWLKATVAEFHVLGESFGEFRAVCYAD